MGLYNNLVSVTLHGGGAGSVTGGVEKVLIGSSLS